MNIVTDEKINNIKYAVAAINACDDCWTEITDFFKQIKSDSDVIYIINTPDSTELLREMLEPVSQIPIQELPSTKLKPNTIYYSPKHVPQDIFLCDIAKNYKEFAIGVCINDQNDHTIIGFSDIKQQGGITFSSEVSEFISNELLEVTDFISSVKFIPKQLQLLSDRFNREKLLHKTRAQIAETESRFKTIADTAPVLIWLSGVDKGCYFFNKGWLNFTGRTMDQEVGNGWADGVHPDDFNRCLKIYVENFDQKKEFYMEYRLRHHSGDFRWISDRGTPRFTEDGEFLGFVGGCMDIHDQKMLHEVLEDKVIMRTSELQAKNELLQQQKKLTDVVFNASVDFMLVYDRNLRFIMFNDSLKKLYKLTDDDIGKSMIDLYPNVKDSPGHHDVLLAIDGERIHTPVYQSEVTGRFYDMNYIPLEIGETVLIVGHDITGRIASESKLHELNVALKLQNDIFGHAEENATIGSYFWNLKTDELKYSDNLIRIMGFELENFEPSFETFFSVIHPDDRKSVMYNAKLTAEKEELSEDVYRIITPDGKIIYCRSKGKFVGEGDHRALIGTVQDITKDVEMNALLKQKNQELQNSNDDLASFNYIASHDLQEPLRKIHMFTSRILERDGENFSSHTLDYFERIESAITRMQNLIQALLSYSNTNPAEIKVSKTNLNALVIEVLSNLEVLIDKKNAIIEAEDLPILEVVPIQFQQLLLNLISNGIKYSKTDVTPHIKITSEKVELEEESGEFYWKISVSDNGIGFEQKYQHKIFDLFQRLHGKAEYEGTGVGLAICKKIVKNHNGFITAEGSPGQGSTFAIYIPAKL